MPFSIHSQQQQKQRFRKFTQATDSGYEVSERQYTAFTSEKACNKCSECVTHETALISAIHCTCLASAITGALYSKETSLTLSNC